MFHDYETEDTFILAGLLSESTTWLGFSPCGQRGSLTALLNSVGIGNNTSPPQTRQRILQLPYYGQSAEKG
jgi:hypothetical protein